MGNQTNNANREKASTWAYVGWLVFGGFLSIAICFFWAVIYIISLFGVNLATHIIKLANYLFAGCEEEIETNYEAAKGKNILWSICAGWFLYIYHLGMYHITKFLRFKNVAETWKISAKLVLHPFGVEIDN